MEWKEFTIKESQELVSEYCAAYDIVAFSCYIWNITQTIETANKIKQINPNVKILLGGPEVSYEYEEILKLSCIDYIIIGEGEIPFLTFMDCYPNIESVPGLAYKFQGLLKENSPPPSFDIQQLNHFNPYQFDDIVSLENKVLYMETSRGCPYKCEFCLASLDNKVRYLSNETIKENLLFLMQHGKVIKFLDRTFNVKKDFTIDIFKFILEHHQTYNIFQFEITADIVHPDIIDFIDKNVPPGLMRFEIGIQTVNQKANLEVGRKQNFEKTSRVIEALKHKIEMHLDLIVGLPFDFWQDVKHSIEEVFKLYPPELQLGFLKFLKGTPVREKYLEHEFVFDPKPPYQIIESKYLSKEELDDIVILENALEIYWNKKRALHTLKYVSNQYGIFDFLLGLGKYFGKNHSFHQYALSDVYNRLFEFVEMNFKDDIILKEMIAIDYYLHHKTRPKAWNISFINKLEWNDIVNQLKLNEHLFRYIIIPIHFNYIEFSKTQNISQLESNLVIEYNGLNWPRVIFNQ